MGRSLLRRSLERASKAAQLYLDHYSGYFSGLKHSAQTLIECWEQTKEDYKELREDVTEGLKRKFARSPPQAEVLRRAGSDPGPGIRNELRPEIVPVRPHSAPPDMPARIDSPQPASAYSRGPVNVDKKLPPLPPIRQRSAPPPPPVGPRRAPSAAKSLAASDERRQLRPGRESAAASTVGSKTELGSEPDQGQKIRR